MEENKIYINRADMITDVDVRMGIARIFGDGFAQWLGFFSKDKEQIAKAFYHLFILDQFYVAIAEDEVIGIAACTSNDSVSMQLDRTELRKYIGWYKGTIAGIVLKKEFEAHFSNQPANSGSIEFVGTSSQHLGQGIASKLLRYIIDTTNYEEYLIEEVADTNTPAMNLYRKLGFVEYKSKIVPRKSASKIVINKFVSFKFIPG